MRDGGRDEVKWLMAREIPRLRRYALALTNNSDAADDLVQDCIERAIRKRHLWKQRGSMRAWLYRILYNVFINQSTHRNRVRRHVDLDEMDGSLSETARQEDRVACQDIAAAMQRLPPDQRAAIVLTAVEELSYDEAAGVLGIPIGTLRSRLSRGRERLRELYADPEQAPATSLRRVK